MSLSIAPNPFSSLLEKIPVSTADWLNDLRTQAATEFKHLGLPTLKSESWSYTNLRILEKLSFRFPSPFTLNLSKTESLPRQTQFKENISLPAPLTSHRLVVVNGQFRPELSSMGELPSTIRVQSLNGTLASDAPLLQTHLGQLTSIKNQPFVALNTALAEDYLVIHVPTTVSVYQPIEVVFLTITEPTPIAVFPRLLVIADDESAVSIIEHHISLSKDLYLTNSVTEIFAGKGSRIGYYVLQQESVEGLHLSTTALQLAETASCDSFILHTGSRLARRQMQATLKGVGADLRLNGAYWIAQEQQSDITTFIDHIAPQCRSREIVKGVIDDHARAVFQGKIIVRPDAQKTDAQQLNRALLLSDSAEIDSKPELEIYADDVKCSHGATAGDLDEQALFYLRARGLDLLSARTLLIQAFLAEIVDEIRDETVRKYIRDIMKAH